MKLYEAHLYLIRFLVPEDFDLPAADYLVLCRGPEKK